MINDNATCDVIVIGGGAAGFYCAVQLAEMQPRTRILILEKSGNLLSKVRISGGGRCNVTHHCFDAGKLSKHYPRGEKQLRKLFKQYGAAETVAWFSQQNVPLKTEDDGRMFPVTDNSETIVQALLQRARQLGVAIHTSEAVSGIVETPEGLKVTTSKAVYAARFVVVATGGHPRPEAYDFLVRLGHTLRAPIPSLFTFNEPRRHFADLMGISVPEAEVRITGTKFRQTGPLLITHWGLSGPAVIRLSAWAAEYLHSVSYRFDVLVSWIGDTNEEQVREFLFEQRSTRARQKVHSHAVYGLPQRLWLRLCEQAQIEEHRIWNEMGNKQINRLLECLHRYSFSIAGKTTFKEEFVTCGGVDLAEVDINTMESKRVKNLFFAGEVLNIDGETGGFNFQAAWSTAWTCAKHIASLT